MSDAQRISIRWRRLSFARLFILVLSLLVTTRVCEKQDNSTDVKQEASLRSGSTNGLAASSGHKNASKSVGSGLRGLGARNRSAVPSKFELRYDERPNSLQDHLASKDNIESLRIPCKDPNAASCKIWKVCGKAPLNSLTPKGQGYIVNGQDQVYGEFPAYVRLEIHDASTKTNVTCGATLVTDRHVVTAAHCVYQKNGSPPKVAEPGHVKVILGEHDVWSRDKFEQVVSVEHVCASTKYGFQDKLEQTHDDWAVLRLAKPVTFTDHVQPACLPFEPIQRAGPSATCFLVGAGLLESHRNKLDTPASIVQKMRVEQVSCRAWKLHDRDATRECYSKAQSYTGDSCGGDSGGPVMCLDKRRRWTLVAAVSYGTEFCDAEDRERSWVGVYARMRTLLGEIKNACAF